MFLTMFNIHFSVCFAALSRYVFDPAVAFEILMAIHFLALEPNNRAWLGAAGACESSVRALRAHEETNAEVLGVAARVVGSLCTDNDANSDRLRDARACELVIRAMTKHEGNIHLSEHSSRAIYHLALSSPINAKLLGNYGGCEAIVSAINRYKNDKDVVRQGFQAIFALIGSEKTLQKENALKLTTAGANEAVIAAMTLQTSGEPCSIAGAKAIGYLAGGVETNRDTLGRLGACELLVTILKAHSSNSDLVVEAASAIEKLTKKHDDNKKRFGDAGCCEILIASLDIHTADATVISIFRAIVSLFYFAGNRQRMTKLEYCRTLVRTLRKCSKSAQGVRWGITAITTLIYDENTATMLGNCRAGDVIVKSLIGHINNPDVSEWACMGLWKLTTIDANKLSLSTTEAIETIVNILKIHRQNPRIVDWCLKLIVPLASFTASSNSNLAVPKDLSPAASTSIARSLSGTNLSASLSDTKVI
jgi:hypothetical protein